MTNLEIRLLQAKERDGPFHASLANFSFIVSISMEQFTVLVRSISFLPSTLVFLFPISLHHLVDQSIFIPSNSYVESPIPFIFTPIGGVVFRHENMGNNWWVLSLLRSANSNEGNDELFKGWKWSRKDFNGNPNIPWVVEICSYFRILPSLFCHSTE